MMVIQQTLQEGQGDEYLGKLIYGRTKRMDRRVKKIEESNS